MDNSSNLDGSSNLDDIWQRDNIWPAIWIAAKRYLNGDVDIKSNNKFSISNIIYRALFVMTSVCGILSSHTQKSNYRKFYIIISAYVNTAV